MPTNRVLDPKESAFVEFFKKLLGSGALGVGSPNLAPSGSGSTNSEALSRLLLTGGSVSITEPGTYTLATWPTGVPVSTKLELGPGVILSDGSATISGPVTLEGGLWPNGKVASDAETTSGQPTVTSTNIAFTQQDVGKGIVVRRADGTAGVFRSTISSVSGTVATCAANVGFTATSCAVMVATNSGTALENLLAERTHVELPKGILYAQASAVLTVRDGCTMSGAGRQFPAAYQFPTEGSVLIAAHTASAAAAVQVGTTTGFGSGKGGATLRDLAVDGFGYVTDAVLLVNWNGVLRDCFVQGGAAAQLNITGVGAEVYDNWFFNRLATFHGIRCNSTDVIIQGNLIRGIGSGMYAISVARAAVRVVGNHTFHDDTVTCGQILITASAGLNVYGCVISENEFEVGLGHQIAIVTSGASQVRSLNISDNTLYHTGSITNNTYDMINAAAAATGSIDGVTIKGNVGYSVTNNYRSIFGDDGAVTATGVLISGNTASGCLALLGGTASAFYSDGNGVAAAAARTTWSAT